MVGPSDLLREGLCCAWTIRGSTTAREAVCTYGESATGIKRCCDNRRLWWSAVGDGVLGTRTTPSDEPAAAMPERAVPQFEFWGGRFQRTNAYVNLRV